MKLKYTDKQAHITKSKLLQTEKKLSDYIKHLHDVVKDGNYNHDESSINCCTDSHAISEIVKLKNTIVTQDLQYIFVVGIGGSNLGTKAIYDALYGQSDIVGVNSKRKIIFLDTNNPAMHVEIKKLISEIKTTQQFIVNIISRSGGTTEVIANAEFLLQELRKKFVSCNNRVVVTSLPGSPLWESAEKNKFHLLEHKKVGGRYSVMSSVGLFPLACLGANIKKFTQGAQDIRAVCIDNKIQKNYAMQSAAILYENYKKGKVVNDNFIFDSQLESLGKWYRQLMGESIGKEKDKQGKKVYTGITPTVSIGSTDLHSVGQLYLGGPKDKTTTFITVGKRPNIKIGTKRIFKNVIPELKGTSMDTIMNAIAQGTQIAYQKQKLPFMHVEIDKVHEYELGQFMQFKMIEMMLLGYLLNVHTFDQPHVELYKVETKKILNKK